MNAQSKRRGLDIERVWVWRDDADGGRLHCLPGPRPVEHAVEYMRVMSRDEVERLAYAEGVDTQQLMNSYLRTIEGQRRQINQLNQIREGRTGPSHATQEVQTRHGELHVPPGRSSR